MENFYKWKEKVVQILIDEYGFEEDNEELTEEEVFANLFLKDPNLAAEEIANFLVDRAEESAMFPA